jgi:hypothetical protein
LILSTWPILCTQLVLPIEITEIDIQSSWPFGRQLFYSFGSGKMPPMFINGTCRTIQTRYCTFEIITIVDGDGKRSKAIQIEIIA